MTHSAPRPNIERVLIIDADVVILTLARVALEVSTTWSVDVARSTIEAAMLSQERRPDVILMDQAENGQDAVTKLRDAAAIGDVPVVLLTADTCATLDPARKIVGIIKKPFDPKTLAHQVEALLTS